MNVCIIHMKFGLDNNEATGLWCVFVSVLESSCFSLCTVGWGDARPVQCDKYNSQSFTMLCVIHLLMVGYFDANSSTTMHHCMFCQLLKMNFTLNRMMMTTCKKKAIHFLLYFHHLSGQTKKVFTILSCRAEWLT